MYRNHVKSICGWIIIVGHLLSAALVMGYLQQYLNLAQRFQILLTLLPLTAAYFTSVARNFVYSQFDTSRGRVVNLNFAVFAIIAPLSLIAFINYLILTYPSTLAGDVPELQTWTAGVELVIGTALGFVVADLFPTKNEEGELTLEGTRPHQQASSASPMAYREAKAGDPDDLSKTTN